MVVCYRTVRLSNRYRKVAEVKGAVRYLHGLTDTQSGNLHTTIDTWVPNSCDKAKVKGTHVPNPATSTQPLIPEYPLRVIHFV